MKSDGADQGASEIKLPPGQKRLSLKALLANHDEEQKKQKDAIKSGAIQVFQPSLYTFEQNELDKQIIDQQVEQLKLLPQLYKSPTAPNSSDEEMDGNGQS